MGILNCLQKLKKIISYKHFLDIVTNGLRLDFKKIPKNRKYQFRTLKNDKLDIVVAEVDKLLSKQVIYKSKRKEMATCLMFSPEIRRMDENA